MTIKEKILSFLEEIGYKKEEYYKAIGVAPSNFKGTGLNSALGGEKVVKTLNLFPNLSADWLLRGEGDMFRQNFDEPKENDQIVSHTGDISSIISHFTDIIEQKDQRIASLERENGMLHERIANASVSSQTKVAG